MVIYHIFSGKYSSLEYLIKCQMFTLYHTLTLYRTPTMCMIILVRMNITISYSINTNDHYIENNTCQNPYHMPYHLEKPISSRGPLGPRDDIGRG
jgi:hypothetical protein